MSKVTGKVSGGRWGTHFHAELNLAPRDRYQNIELTVTAKLHLRQKNPASGASGTAADFNGNATDIIRWTPNSWKHWKELFVKHAMKYSGKFWLINNRGYGAFEERGEIYIPNIWCLLKIDFVDSRASAYHTIDVYRVPPSGRDFRSSFNRMDSHDVRLQEKKKDSRNKWIKQRPAVHELFHMLGVRHIDHGEPNCPAASSGNASTCYGNTDADSRTLMGSGMKIHTKMAEPWRRAAIELTRTGSLANAKDWAPQLKRHYPRTMSEFRNKVAVKRRRHRL